MRISLFARGDLERYAQCKWWKGKGFDGVTEIVPQSVTDDASPWRGSGAFILRAMTFTSWDEKCFTRGKCSRGCEGRRR